MTGNDSHWTDDDELLAKFVMHRLTPSGEEQLIAHARECQKCMDAVRDETRIVAGITLAGRSAMKDRLKSRLQAMESNAASRTRNAIGFDIPWTRVASIAAVLAIIITVGVYNNWFTNDRYLQTLPEQVAQEQPSPAAGTSRDDERMSEKQREESPSTNTTPHTAKEGLNERLKKNRDIARNEERKSADESGGGSEQMNKTESLIRRTDEAMVPPPQAFWVEGHVNASNAAMVDGKYDQLSARQKLQARAEEESPGQKDNRSGPGDQRTSPNITLNQKPASSLPPSQQYIQGQRGSVQTFIRDKSGTLDMTLYMDSLVSESDLNAAIVQTIGADSLVINLSNQQIGYRLPPGLSDKVNRKAKR